MSNYLNAPSDSSADFEFNLKNDNEFYFINGTVMLQADFLNVKIDGIQEEWPVRFRLNADRMKGLSVHLTGLLESDNWSSLNIESKRTDDGYDLSKWIIALMTGPEFGNV